MDDLPSPAGSGSDDVEAPCLSAESAPGSGDDEEGHPPHLYDMSSLKAQLPLPPLRRGLSRFYSGKSQSFESLGCVKAVEDLPEPEPEPGRRIRRGNGCKKQMIAANLHGCSNLSKVIRKATRMDVRPPSGRRDHQTVLASDGVFFRLEAESHLRMK